MARREAFTCNRAGPRDAPYDKQELGCTAGTCSAMPPKLGRAISTNVSAGAAKEVVKPPSVPTVGM